MHVALIPSTSNPGGNEGNPVGNEGTFTYELDAFMRVLSGQQIVSTSRCINGLLDLYNVTLDPAARQSIENALRDVRHTNAVRGEDLVRALIEIDRAALVDHALA